MHYPEMTNAEKLDAIHGLERRVKCEDCSPQMQEFFRKMVSQLKEDLRVSAEVTRYRLRSL